MTPLEVRFWTKVDKRGPDECWPWLSTRQSFGHGQFWLDGRYQPAHRIMIEFTTGVRVPDHLCALHKCDNPPCVNSAHLFVGTYKDNMADMHAKGRARPPRGERMGTAIRKLSLADVRKIRARVVAGETQVSIARAFGVGVTTINHIVKGRTWATEF